jgi:hypothetical protein
MPATCGCLAFGRLWAVVVRAECSADLLAALAIRLASLSSPILLGQPMTRGVVEWGCVSYGPNQCGPHVDRRYRQGGLR